MVKKDYYDVLGISKNASANEIKSAYKSLAKKFHPDVSKEEDSEKKFKEVLEAYSVLSDPQKKQNYDQFGFSGDKFSGFQGFDFRNFSSSDFDFEDIFQGVGSIFGEQFGFGRKTPKRGNDLRFDLNISFKEAAFGTKKEIGFERVEQCDDCSGSGAKDEKSIILCSNCNGSGTIRKTQRTILGMISTQTNCNKCGGKGKQIKENCKKCHGLGRTKIRRKIKITIPEGVNTGMHLKLNGEGNEGEIGAEKGDLFVVLFVEPHEFFKRDNGDVLIDIPIALTDAVLGAEIEVPTLNGKAKLKIPDGTQSGTLFRLKKQGIKDYRTQEKGHQFVKVLVEIPKKLSKTEKQLFEEIKKTEKISSKNTGFFDFFRKNNK